jgi:hypothetical protein
MPPPIASPTPDTPFAGTTLVGTASDTSRVTRQTKLTSNTGGRARQNWRNSISSAVGSLRRANTTTNPARLGPISAPIRRLAADNTDESPTDPSLIPSRPSPAIKLPASPFAGGPITKPDEPRSFLDLDSDDSSEDDLPYSQPVISRANSVRVQRPTLVQNRSGDDATHSSSGVTIEVYNGDLLQTLRTVPTRMTSRPMSTHKKDAEESTPVPKTPATETTNESTRGMGPEHAYKKLTANAPSPQFVSRFSATTVDRSPSNVETADTSAGLGPEAALKVFTGVEDDASTTALAPTAKSQDTSSTTALALTPPRHSTKDAEETRSSVYGGITMHSEPIGEDAMFGHPEAQGSNIKEGIIEMPNTPTTQSTLPSPFGGFGAVRLLHKARGNPFRPLGMNPVDADAARLHRAISAPPLPSQHPHCRVTISPPDLVIADSRGDHKHFRDQVVTTPYPARSGSFANPEEDLAEREGLSTVDEKSDRFPSPNREEVLVLQLATARHAGAMKTVVISITDKGTFDDEQLFKEVKKAYSRDLLGPTRRVFSARQLSHATFSNDTSFKAEDFVTHLNHPKTGHKRKGWLAWLRQHQPTGSESSKRDSYASYYSPPSIPRMPFKRSLPLPPKVVLHFEFSVLAISVAVGVCLVLGCLATILWVLVGVPGFDVGLSERDWRHDAESRVLTGLVLGLLVLSLSSLGSALWIGGSYVLL